ncbi:MAG: hydantoinase B/oxoprolinase family protein [Alphaproteobacteria bacterium]
MNLPAASNLDPADTAVISQALTAAAREMGAKLVRSAYSTIVREARDASAALLDRRGNTIAQAELIPIQLGSIGQTLAPCLARFPAETLGPGDILVNNDPYDGGQHLQDVFIFTPVFVDDRLVAFSASVAHHLDLGGGNPGLNVSATDVYQEGIILPPSRFNLARDWNGGPFERFVAANVRVPSQTIGDFNAQIAANQVGVARVSELVRRYGAEIVERVMDAMLDYAERRVRAALAELPDGVYRGEDWLDDDGVHDEPIPVRVTLTKRGDTLDVDYAGTADQVARNVNAPFASTVSATLSCLKLVLTGPDVPFNEGAKRPITIRAPLGSLLNPRHPAPVRARMEPCYRAFGAVMRALAQAAPERVMAAGYDTTTAISLAHLDPRGYRVYIDIAGGGWGARLDGDGEDALAGPLGNCSNTPAEVIDAEYGYFRVVEYAMRPGSAGAGRHRGGVGLRRVFEVTADAVNFAIYADRFTLAPRGLFGGAGAVPARLWLERDGAVTPIHSKATMMLQLGDRLVLETAGGGGYGDPALRLTRDLERDAAEGLGTAIG